MSLWCDKYRPASLNKLDFNKEQGQALKNFVQSNDFPHLFIYGPSGAGKKTRIHCTLKEMFGSGVDKLRMEHHTFETPSKRKIEVRTVSSNFHIEVNPSDCGIYDRVALLELVKSTATMRTLNDKALFTVFVITEADKMTKEAQQGLRRTMEKYTSSCRFILTGETSSRIIPAIKSRCMLIRVAAPSIDAIAEIVHTTSKKECFPIEYDEAMAIAKNCDRNLRRALLMAETMKVTNLKEVVQPQWFEFIKTMAAKMMSMPTPRGLEEARNNYFELQAHLIPPELIFKFLIDSLLTKIKSEGLKGKLIKLAAFYEHKMRLGSKHVIHFEAFAAHFMSAIKESESSKGLTGDIHMAEENLMDF